MELPTWKGAYCLRHVNPLSMRLFNHARGAMFPWEFWHKSKKPIWVYKYEKRHQVDYYSIECSCSASFHCPWLQYVIARFAMLVSVTGCSPPRTLFPVPETCTSATLPHSKIQLHGILVRNLCIAHHCKPLESSTGHCVDWRLLC